MTKPVFIIGAGLAGSEAALQLARRGIRVRLFEMKPQKRTPAQVSDDLAELVCSNSFRSASLDNAVGVIKEEMRLLGGALIRFADAAKVPAGSALAVDREVFSRAVTEAILCEPLIDLVRREVTRLPDASEADDVVVATGPLTSPELSSEIGRVTSGGSHLYFYDAIAPIVAADSVDMSVAFRASRYGKGDGDDYLNCPMTRPEYEAFHAALLAAEKVTPHDFEEARYFEGCLPIEVMADRGADTLRFGPMKPVGLPDPRTGKEAFAVVQLRAENLDRTAYNLVGFQTRMKWGDQQRVLRMIPGLGEAEFLRMGQIHRNTYLDSPVLLDDQLRLKAQPHIQFAGQITGVEGYVESTACGLLVGLMIVARRRGRTLPLPPPTSALGALHAHVLGKLRAPSAKRDKHMPSNIHWGLFPAITGRAPKRERKRLYGERALADMKRWIEAIAPVLGDPSAGAERPR
jgi:methylenetetrahydrofolate--tRNA-(uracil-5-)-methyltransferase